jgi:iron(III) transport system ATP-binding protein
VTASRPISNGEAGNDEHVLAVQGTNWRGQCRAAAAFGEGDKVLVVIRPEDATLIADDAVLAEGQLGWRGRIVDGVFRGPRRSLAVQTDVLRFRVECPAMREMPTGDTATIVVDSQNAWAIHA